MSEFIAQTKREMKRTESSTIRRESDPIEEEDELQRESIEDEDELQRESREDEEELQRESVEDEEELQREPAAGASGGNLSAGLSNRIQEKRGSGSPLSPSIRKTAEAKLGGDFSGVRVHDDMESDQLSQSINARAFTIGSDIFLSKKITPSSDNRSQATMIHELTHVAQQGGKAASGPLKVGAVDTTEEKEASLQSGQIRREPIQEAGSGNVIRRSFGSFMKNLGNKILSKGLSILNKDVGDDYFEATKKVNDAKAMLSPELLERYEAKNTTEDEKITILQSVDSSINTDTMAKTSLSNSLGFSASNAILGTKDKITSGKEISIKIPESGSGAGGRNIPEADKNKTDDVLHDEMIGRLVKKAIQGKEEKSAKAQAILNNDKVKRDKNSRYAKLEEVEKKLKSVNPQPIFLGKGSIPVPEGIKNALECVKGVSANTKEDEITLKWQNTINALRELNENLQKETKFFRAANEALILLGEAPLSPSRNKPVFSNSYTYLLKFEELAGPPDKVIFTQAATSIAAKVDTENEGGIFPDEIEMPSDLVNLSKAALPVLEKLGGEKTQEVTDAIARIKKEINKDADKTIKKNECDFLQSVLAALPKGEPPQLDEVQYASQIIDDAISAPQAAKNAPLPESLDIQPLRARLKEVVTILTESENYLTDKLTNNEFKSILVRLEPYVEKNETTTARTAVTGKIGLYIVDAQVFNQYKINVQSAKLMYEKAKEAFGE